MEQPASHHLDVFDHCLSALDWMERIIHDPGRFFGEVEVLENYLEHGRNRLLLCWAALLHDIGKPPSYGINEDKGGRITFYDHDQEGRRLVATIGERLRGSGLQAQKVGGLIGLHMRPFHLSNFRREQELSLKAKVRLVRAAGPDLEGLFLLAMADSLAGKGAAKPEEMELELDELLCDLLQVRRDNVEPVQSGPPLLTGRDLIEELKLQPGPLFSKILDTIEQARMEQRISTSKEALEMAKSFKGSQ
jgi:poly(A) polymerase